MNASVVRRSRWTLGTLLATVALVACEDKAVKEVNKGMTRDSVMSAMAKNATPVKGAVDSMPGVFKRSEYLIDAQRYEVLYFSPDGKRIGKDSARVSELTPIVLINGRVVGKGWDYWDSVATARKIPLPARDSMLK